MFNSDKYLLYNSEIVETDPLSTRVGVMLLFCTLVKQLTKVLSKEKSSVVHFYQN